MGLIERLFGGRQGGEAALYDAVIARGRAPHWYQAGGVPDTMEGRFDMIATILAFVLIRLEQDESARGFSVRLTERFIADMDGQLRQTGVGDVGVGKYVGQMLSLLGGRLGAYRDAGDGKALAAALERNLYRGAAPDAAALAHVSAALIALRERLAQTATPQLLDGALP